MTNKYPDTGESGDTYDKEQEPSVSVEGQLPKRRFKPSKALLPIAISVCLVLSVTSFALIYGTATQTFNVGKSLVSVSASYGFANNNSSIVGFPGDINDPVVLTVVNGHRTASNIQITFNVTNPLDWTPSYASGCVFSNASLYIDSTLTGGLILPTNANNNFGVCTTPPLANSFTYHAPVGTSTVNLYLSIANNYQPNTFTIQWFAQPV